MVVLRREPSPGDTDSVDLGYGARLELIWCPPGEFLMGSANDFPSESLPQHLVRLTRGFWMGKYPVTQLQWKMVLCETDYYACGEDDYFDGFENLENACDPDDYELEVRALEQEPTFPGWQRPMDSVSCNDARAFCTKLSRMCPGRFRLPTEAEWEYACRAGTTTRYSFGDDASRLSEYAWYRDNSSETAPVGLLKPNPWGFHDMHGNVREWCLDFADHYSSGPETDPTGPSPEEFRGTERILRGGSYDSHDCSCTSSYRSESADFKRQPWYGFRVLRLP